MTRTDPTALSPDAVVAIDGPAGSGKSTTARALARRFGLLYIDTGAMYRALTIAALSTDTPLNDGKALAKMLASASLELRPAKGEGTVLWNGADVSVAIRTPEVEKHVSLVASHAVVRAQMVQRQQDLGRRGGVVMEGRDIGSVVFPLATVKIFLSASLDARVDRRYRQYLQRGRKVSREDLYHDLGERDRQDRERAASPLQIGPDAFVIDSSALTLDEQTEACARACLVNPELDRLLDTDLAVAQREIPTNYRFAYGVMRALARFFGLKQVGNEGAALPRGCIIAVNHISMWDPPLVGSTFHRYPVHTLAKAELFRIWPIGPIFRWIDSIPIERKGYDAHAFDEARSVLQKGHNLLIFPEGTRRAIGHPGPVRSGLGIVVQATRAPVVPVFIRGSYGRFPGGSLRSPAEVSFGPVIRWHGLEALQKELGPKEVSAVIGKLCENMFSELQDRSFERTPQTQFERELSVQQLAKFAARQKKIFRR